MRMKIVNPLGEELFESIVEVIRKAEKGLDSIDNYYDELAQGTCGTVYAINEELVLKVNDLVYSLKYVNDHIVLESLQGLPFVPTLYAYTPDGKYLIIQRIKGLTLCELGLNSNPYQFNYEELVLKANDLVYSLKDVNDHIVLESLQGLPFVPTLYAYTPDGKYLIIQRIKGLTLWELELNNNPYQFNYEELKQQFKEFVAGCLERGWIPNDLHAGNVMVCPQGVYVVDYGFFKRCDNPARMNSYRRQSMECELDYLEEMLERVSADYNSSRKKSITVNFLSLSVLP